MHAKDLKVCGFDLFYLFNFDCAWSKLQVINLWIYALYITYHMPSQHVIQIKISKHIIDVLREEK
jgi:hypothetical protein